MFVKRRDRQRRFCKAPKRQSNKSHGSEPSIPMPSRFTPFAIDPSAQTLYIAVDFMEYELSRENQEFPE
ncbi:hypothetical protein V1478_004740 [Vespula squamosa]|uniref:Uncharacterized protein n=1 Tax=Vespula squamosa TaxID=30214 RepID=A0ABD2BH18_VESSQ